MRTGIAFLFSLLLTGRVISQWTEIDGPYGGCVTSFTFNGLSGQLFIGTSGNGIYTSTDNGSQWYTANNGLLDKKINKIKIYKNHLYACTYSGLYKSTNNGNNWYLLGLQNKSLLSIAFKDSFILVGAPDSLYRSFDYGLSWNSIANHGSNNPIYDLKIIDSIACMGSEFGGFFISTDLGLTWHARNSGLSSLNIRSIVYNDSVLYCGTFGQGVYRSSDFGLNWIKIGLNFNQYITSMIFNGSKHYIGTFNSGFYQRNLGDSVWSAIDNNLDTKMCYDIIFYNNYLYGATVSGIFKCHKDTLYWTDINHGIKNFSVSDIVINSTENTWLLSSNNGIFVSTNEGNGWMQKNKNLPAANYQIKCLLNETGTYRAGSSGDGLYSANSLFFWTKINSPANIINKIVRLDSLYVLLTETQGIYTWDGTNWINRNNGLPEMSTRDIITDTPAWYVGTKLNGVFKTADHGNSWFALNDSLTEKRIFSLVSADSFIFAGTEGGGVFGYSANENRWYKRINGMTGSPMIVYKLYYCEHLLFAGTNSGIYYSTNNGLNWISMNTGIVGNVMAVTLNNTNVIIGTDKGFVYTKPLQDFVSISESQSLPNAVILHQNYPNPFNPSTVISYQLAMSGKVSLKIYNMLGQEVRTLVNAVQSAGLHEITWDGKNKHGKAVSSGVYLYRLETGNSIQTKKMLLMK